MTTSPATMYCNSMEDVKRRLTIVLSVVERVVSLGHQDFDAELVCVQLRKVLELIALASLSANKDKYSEVYKNFESHWHAERIIEALNKIHPEFYPKPVESASKDEIGNKQLTQLMEGFLSKDEFIMLYKKCSEVLHSRNPFRSDSLVIDFGYSIRDWVSRIQKLLKLHYISPAGSDDIWLVQMQHPEDGKVHLFMAEPTN